MSKSWAFSLIMLEESKFTKTCLETSKIGLISCQSGPIGARIYASWVVSCYTGMVGLAQSGSDWLQMGQIRGFFRSDFSAFGAPAPNALKSDRKKPRICPIWGQSDPLWSQTYHPCLVDSSGILGPRSSESKDKIYIFVCCFMFRPGESDLGQKKYKLWINYSTNAIFLNRSTTLDKVWVKSGRIGNFRPIQSSFRLG